VSCSGILAIGAYAPQQRLRSDAFAEAWGRSKAAGIEEKSVAAPDEDTVTMAYEAGRRALKAGALQATDIDRVSFATTTPPTAEEDPTVQLATMLGVPGDATVQLYTGSTRAGTQALLRTLDYTDEDTSALVVASDAPRGTPESHIEHAAGAGAAAFVVGSSPPVTIEDTSELSTLSQGTRFRRTGESTVDSLDITTYERSTFVDTVADAVAAVDVAPATVDSVAIQAPDGRLPYRAGDAIDVDASKITECTPVHSLGDLGAASVALGIARAVEEGQSVLAVSFGSGAGSDAFHLETRESTPCRMDLEGGTTITYGSYLQHRGCLTSGPPDGGGAYVSLPAWQRSIPQRYHLEAGACPRCAALNFPPTGACSRCHETVSYSTVSLEPRGTVEAVTVISRGGAPPEFAEQQEQTGDFAVAIVAFEGPDDRTASIPAQVVEADPDSVSVGDPVSATIRRIYTQEGVTRYGFKVRPD
jgi:hydroxymethylglutaryl-CoA synthase